MSEPKTGGVLAASLHQAIAELMPARLDFYENWLPWNGTRGRGFGRAPLAAVLGFLRAEGRAYDPVLRRAGQWTARWVVEAWPRPGRRLVAGLPVPLRARLALRAGRSLVRRTWPSSRARVRVRGRTAEVEVIDSVFCEVREPVHEPQCGFYAAAFAALLADFVVTADVRVRTCRATGASSCVLAVDWGAPRPSDGPAVGEDPA